MEILSDPTPDMLAMPRFDDCAIDMQELHLERRHSSPCHAAFLPGTGLSATTSVMILTACSAAVSSSSRPGVMRLNLVMVELRDYPKMRCLMLERTPLV